VSLPVVSPQLHLRPVLNARMSAIPTDEPAQDAPPSLDTQQILQQQDSQLNSQSVSGEPNRKRSSNLIYCCCLSPHLCSNQRRHRRFGGLVLLVTLAKQDVVKFCHARLVLLSSYSLSHSGSIRIQSCLKRGLGTTCAYPDPDAQEHHGHQTPGTFYCLDHCNALSHCCSFSHSYHHQCSICTSTNVCNSASA
jgi:hypothetical protein